VEDVDDAVLVSSKLLIREEPVKRFAVPRRTLSDTCHLAVWLLICPETKGQEGRSVQATPTMQQTAQVHTFLEAPTP